MKNNMHDLHIYPNNQVLLSTPPPPPPPPPLMRAWNFYDFADKKAQLQANFHFELVVFF